RPPRHSSRGFADHLHRAGSGRQTRPSGAAQRPRRGRTGVRAPSGSGGRGQGDRPGRANGERAADPAFRRRPEEKAPGPAGRAGRRARAGCERYSAPARTDRRFVKQLLELGYVSRAHGLSGEVAVKTAEPPSLALTVLERVVVRARDGSEREL